LVNLEAHKEHFLVPVPVTELNWPELSRFSFWQSISRRVRELSHVVVDAVRRYLL